MNGRVSIGPATIVGYGLAAAGIALALVEGDTDFAKWGAAIAALTNAGRQLQARAAPAPIESLLPTDAQELASPPSPVRPQTATVPDGAAPVAVPQPAD